jgi:hypothetical protein
VSELVLLAVTKMLSGICLAGVPPRGGEWVRPVKAFGTILPGDVRYADGSWMAPFDLVELNLLKPRSQPPHVEDWTCDFVRPRPWRVRTLSLDERRELLEGCLDPAAQAEWAARRRSLVLTRPADLTAHFALDGYSSHYEARLEWPGCGRPRGVPVTDLRWRALGRRLVPPEGGQVTLSLAALRDRVGCQTVYLALGLSRTHQGEHWPIVVGAHCLPDYEVALDPANL